MRTKEERRRYYGRTPQAEAFASREPWTDWEDDLVLAHEEPDIDLARDLGRTLSAIQHRRSHLRRTKEE